MNFNISNEDLATVDLITETADMTTVEKVEWSYQYTHRAANRQGQLVRAWQAGTISRFGQEIAIPQAILDAWKAEINALADRIVIAQNYVASVTE